MNNQTPKETGFYWVKSLLYNRPPFEPVEVVNIYDSLMVREIGSQGLSELEKYTWGPQIPLPNDQEFDQ